jgi:8-oxo-dGTP pyrophosphatase MutT (NUDIX family)
MYEIYIANKALRFGAARDLESKPGVRYSKVVPYSHDLNLIGLLKLMLNGGDHSDVAVTHDEPAIPYARTVAQMAWEEAAGGIVLSPDRKRILLIFRRGYWDLPKGKPERNESTPECALREVKEETGLKNVRLVEAKPIGSTCHVFTKGEIFVLKKTLWFEMESPDQEVKPQRTEDIEKVMWVERQRLNEYMPGMHRSLQGLVGRYVTAP